MIEDDSPCRGLSAKISSLPTYTAGFDGVEDYGFCIESVPIVDDACDDESSAGESDNDFPTSAQGSDKSRLGTTHPFGLTCSKEWLLNQIVEASRPRITGCLSPQPAERRISI